MGYPNSLDTILLNGWEPWSTGTEEIPGKNITLKNNKTGSILISAEGITIYKKDLNSIYEDESCVLAYSPDKNTAILSNYLTNDLLNETKQMAIAFEQYENTYIG